MQTANKKMLALMLIFIVPMVIGWMLFYFSDYLHFKTTNHGTFIRPPINGMSLDQEKKWRVLITYSKECDMQCKKVDSDLHQVQKALGKNRDRVSIKKINVKAPSFTLIQEQFQKQNVTFNTADKIYLMDPMGNIFMYYPNTEDPLHVLTDLKKVLEVSQIG